VHLPDNDTELIYKLRNGDEQALSYLFDQFYKALCYFAFRIINNKEEAEDIVIGVFSKLWDRKGDFENLLKIKGFLYVTTRNGCYDYLRKAAKENKTQKDLLNLLTQNEDEYFEAEKTMAEVLRKVYAEIENLPVQCKTVLKLSVFEGLKSKEIADQLNISVSNVTSQKSRAVKLVKTALLKQKVLFWFWWF